MGLSEKITDELKVAMKQKQADKVATLRLLVAAFKNAQIEKGKTLEGKDEIEVLRREAKQRQESIEAYEKAGRQDLASKEKAELELIKVYLPQQMSETEIKQFAEKLPELEGLKDNFGAAMKLVMGKLAGKADGKLVAKVIRELA